MKKVAIIGAGFTGLSCAWELTKSNTRVVLFEAGDTLGGLAGSFRGKNWDQPLEKYYHHVFTNDDQIRNLAQEIGSEYQDYSLKTASFTDGGVYQLDSPVSLLRFTPLSILARLWMGVGLLLLKLIKNGSFFEKWRVVDVLPKLISPQGYNKIWYRLLKAKFGKYLPEVNMAWFWSRVAKRTQKLAYFDGGFEALLKNLAAKVESNDGQILLNQNIESIKKVDNMWQVGEHKFDAVVITAPAPVTERLTDSKVRFAKINYLWGQTLILETTREVGDSYWLNILEEKYPFLVVVNQTKLVDSKHYNGHKVVYLGNYLEPEDKRLQMTKEELLDLYLPYIKKIDPSFKETDILDSFVFQSPYAQPVFPINYQRTIPKMNQGGGMFVANMSMVYPFDRGTNYAVAAGAEAAREVEKYLS